MPDSDGGERATVTVTMPQSTLDYLREMYPDATSDSMRLLMAISDARKLDQILAARRVTEVAIEDPED